MKQTTNIVKLSTDNCDGYLSSIAQLEQLCFGRRAWTQIQLRQEIANTFAIVFAYNLGTELAGYISARSVADELQISNIAVFPQYRKQGIAWALLDMMKESARTLGNTVIELEVAVDNVAAINLYTKYGFVAAGTRRNFYPDDGRGGNRDAITMLYKLV